MDLLRVPIAKIRVPDVRVTAVYDEETQTLLRETVAKLGVVSPVILVQVGEVFDLVDGLHRMEEERRLGKTEIDAVVYEGGAVDTLLLNLLLNKTRGKVKASELVTVVGELYDKHGIGIEAIHEKTGVPQAYIERLIQISQASESVREALDQEIISVSAAFEISRLPTHRQQDEVCALQGLWRVPVKELKKLIDDTLRYMEEPVAPATGDRKVVVPQYACHLCKRPSKLSDLRMVYVCMDCFTDSWRATAPRRDGVEQAQIPDKAEAKHE